MAEACADIWAAIITHEIYPNDENKIWKIGDDVVLSNSGNTCIRNLATPNDLMAEIQMDTCLCQVSFGNTYQQSGIISHWFYLLTHGFSGKGCDDRCYAFPAMPIDSAAKLIYNCERYYFYENMDFSDIIRATIDAAAVFGTPSNYLPSICGAWNVLGASTCEIDENLGIEQYGLSFNSTNNGDYHISHTIIIDSLQVLTVNGTLYMNDGTSIIVRPGGKLIVDGGTLTNACDGEMWQGIIVEGNANQKQNIFRQGSVTLTNATIENARNAISTHTANDSIWVGGGGIISATNTLFRNNRRSAEFLAYENHGTSGNVINNVSIFSRCTFTIDDDNLFAENGTSFEKHISLWQVRGVKFEGCTFRNEVTAATGAERGSAILSIEAGFLARRTCPQMSTFNPCNCMPGGGVPVTRCTFEGFHSAIFAADSEGNYDITIDNCDFAQNGYGVDMAVCDNVRVSFCDFDLESNASACYGVILSNCTGYTIEDNSFHRPSHSGVHYAYGIRVDNSGTAENVIRRNGFLNMNYGCYIQSTNALTGMKPRGLQFNCNDFDHCKMGIYASGGSKIRSMQGSASSGADNTFSQPVVGGKSIAIPNGHDTVTYYYSTGNGHLPYGNSRYRLITATANACASTLCGIQAIQRDGAALARYRAMAEEYAALIADARNASLQTDADDPQDIDTTALQMRLSDLSAAMGDLSRTAIRAILSDTVVDMALLKEWYRAIVETMCTSSLQTGQPTDLPVEAYQLAEVYNTEGDYAAADALLASLPQRFNPDEPSRNEYGNYLNLQRLRENVAGNWYRQTAAEIAELQRVAEYDNGRAARMAKDILCFFHEICYADNLLLDMDGMGERGARRDAIHRVPTTENGAITLYPNPTHTTLTVESDSPVREITVYDQTGRTVTVETCHGASLQQVVNTSSLHAGIYLLKVVTETGIETAKFVKN